MSDSIELPDCETQIEQMKRWLDGADVFGVVICHPDRPLRYGAFPADTPEQAIEAALVIFEVSERIIADESHVDCIFPLGKGGNEETIERDRWWGSMMRVHTNGRRMDPREVIDSINEKENGNG